jgi:RimJ/RimL family protein N-acetyltransferase
VREQVLLRDVVADDLPLLFQQQLDPDALRMAAFPARDQRAFSEHWAKVLIDATVLKKTIVAAGAVAGYVASFDAAGERLVGYWLGREHWGRGIATRALHLFLDLEPHRPLRAHVARHNLGSIRVLEKCGFHLVSHAPIIVNGETVDDLVMALEG